MKKPIEIVHDLGQNVRIKLGGCKGVPRSDVSETYKGVHQSKLSWMTPAADRQNLYRSPP